MEIDILLGKTLISIERLKEGYEDAGNDNVLIFTTDTNEKYKAFHDQDCCEAVEIYDIEGNLNDLIGSPLTQAEEYSNSDDPPSNDDLDRSWTWTFYKFATIKGYVTIRWLGESNGYYSESIDFIKL